MKQSQILLWAVIECGRGIGGSWVSKRKHSLCHEIVIFGGGAAGILDAVLFQAGEFDPCTIVSCTSTLRLIHPLVSFKICLRKLDCIVRKAPSFNFEFLSNCSR